MKVSAAIAEILRREGVDVIFGYPRNAVLETAAAIGIRPVIVRQERTGVHMADALSRLTRGRRMGVFAMQHGPGTENAYGGVAQAYSESVPVLVLPQGYARRIAHVPDNFNASISMRDVTKTAEPILRAEDTPAVLRRAFSACATAGCAPPCRNAMGRAGRGDPGGTGLPPGDQHPLRPRSGGGRGGGGPAGRRAALVIHAGQGVHWAEAYAELRELAELLGAPVSTSLEGKSAFDETHPLALGSGGAAIPGQPISSIGPT
jgi:acetolactate synthase-1/2/3 large subunit